MIDLRSVSALLDDLEVSYRIEGETAIVEIGTETYSNRDGDPHVTLFIQMPFHQFTVFTPGAYVAAESRYEQVARTLIAIQGEIPVARYLLREEDGEIELSIGFPLLSGAEMTSNDLRTILVTIVGVLEKYHSRIIGVIESHS